MDLSKFYIAILGDKQSNNINIEAKPIQIFNTTIRAVEVYESPFDALSGLNRVTKIRPEATVTLYETCVSNNYIINLSQNNDSHLFSLIDIEIQKVQELVLGSITKYL